ncbi:hypothetical protein AB0D08_29425 [Kitasatospora sp. NPDC048540]|uniref:hypothetical protein n=1 Tax=Kitasatospora sp. NPDC048540 TaxID=3155634 RepID=UPI0033F54F50
MRRRHSFHLDRAGHSVTVNIRSGWITETELLVDGREIAFHRAHGPGGLPRTLCGVLPGRPGAFLVRIDRPAPGAPELRCELELDGAVLPMTADTGGP